jgi:hypothetical protein
LEWFFQIDGPKLIATHRYISLRRSLDNLGETRDGFGVTDSVAVVNPLHISCIIIIIINIINIIIIINIKMDLQEVGGGHGDWMELAQDRDGWRALVSTVKNLRVP